MYTDTHGLYMHTCTEMDAYLTLSPSPSLPPSHPYLPSLPPSLPPSLSLTLPPSLPPSLTLPPSLPRMRRTATSCWLQPVLLESPATLRLP